MTLYSAKDGKTWLYTIYVEKVRVLGEVPVGTRVVCRWYIDSASDCSEPFTLVAAQSVRISYCSFLVVSFADASMRARKCTLTLSLGSDHICAAFLDLSSFSPGEAFQHEAVELRNRDGVFALADIHTASQKRWTRGAPVEPRKEAFFAKAISDAQAEWLDGQITFKNSEGGSESRSGASTTVTSETPSSQDGGPSVSGDPKKPGAEQAVTRIAAGATREEPAHTAKTRGLVARSANRVSSTGNEAQIRLQRGLATSAPAVSSSSSLAVGSVNPSRPQGFVYDLVVLGTPSSDLLAAKEAASEAARRGAKSAFVHRSHNLVEDQKNRSTNELLHSKALLLRSARAAFERRRAHLLCGGLPSLEPVDFPAIMERLRRLRGQLASADSCHEATKTGPDMYRSPAAAFKSPHEIVVDGQVLKFRKAIVATGVKAKVPSIPGIEGVYLTKDTLLSLAALPPRLVVLGAGAFGCEMAQAFARLGSSVTVIEREREILPGEDADAAAVLRAALKLEGVRILSSTSLERVEVDATNGVNASEFPSLSLRVSSVASGSGTQLSSEELRCEALLFACGEELESLTDDASIGLQAASVEYDPRYGITINDRLQTSNLDIFSLGKSCCSQAHQARSPPASSARSLASLAVQQALFGKGLPANVASDKLSEIVLPRVVHTDPEVASCGFSTADSARKLAGLETDEYLTRSDMSGGAVLSAFGGNEFIRVLCRRGTEDIVGATVVAEHAGEVLSEITLAVQHKVGLSKIGRTVHPYPSVVESIQQCGVQRNRRGWQMFGDSCWAGCFR